jgi:hypothetical protein
MFGLRAHSMEPPSLYENRRSTFNALSPQALVERGRWILPLQIPKSGKN